MKETNDEKDGGKVIRIVVGVAILTTLVNIALILPHWDEIMFMLGSADNPTEVGQVEFNDAVEVR